MGRRKVKAVAGRGAKARGGVEKLGPTCCWVMWGLDVNSWGQSTMLKPNKGGLKWRHGFGFFFSSVFQAGFSDCTSTAIPPQSLDRTQTANSLSLRPLRQPHEQSSNQISDQCTPFPPKPKRHRSEDQKIKRHTSCSPQAHNAPDTHYTTRTHSGAAGNRRCRK